MLRPTVAAAALSLLLAGSARADVLYTFVQTGYGGPWKGQYQGPAVDISFELSDAAVRSGSFSLSQEQFPYWQTGDAGLDALTASAPRLQVTAGPGYGVFTMGLTFGAKDQILSSSFHLDTSGDTEYVNLDGTQGKTSGAFYTDDPADPCYQVGVCTFTGHWVETQVPVPEPGSLLVLGSGLLGFGLMLARRRPRAGAQSA